MLNDNETSTLVAKMVTIHSFLVIATTKSWELHQMDVYNDFLYGDLEEEVYMKLPSAFNLQIQTKYTTFKSPYTDSNKLLDVGLQIWLVP